MNRFDIEYLNNCIDEFYQIFCDQICCILNYNKVYLAATDEFAQVFDLDKNEIIGKSSDEFSLNYIEENIKNSYFICKIIKNPETNKNFGLLMFLCCPAHS